MTLRVPLLGKILGWFFLNLLLLGIIAGALFRSEFRPEALINGAGGERFQRVVDTLLGELRDKPRDGWDVTLKRYSATYDFQFVVVDERAEVLAGGPLEIPEVVRNRLRAGRGIYRPEGDGPEVRRSMPFPERRGGPPPEDARGGRPGGFRGPPSEENRGRPPGMPARALVRTANPDRYWALFPASPLESGPRRLVAVSSSLAAGGLLVDFRPWMWAGFAVLAISVMWWIPFVRGITRSLREMTHATEQIAEGRFHTAVMTHRGDEIGRLGNAIQGMAGRLDRLLSGQKRFLGDVSHELCAPIARLQMALGILEQRADAGQQQQVADLREELDHMSALVNELLSFSKAGLRRQDMPLVSLPLLPVVMRVLDREGAVSGVDVRINPGDRVMAEPELLARALGNLVRNAIRYAGHAGPITISSHVDGAMRTVSVADNGPGVPPGSLARLGEPFFRPDAARTREQGGTGLGLAIVKTCIESCQGTLILRNREPRGFAAELKLKDGSA